jgi:hypothetical protein
MKIRRYYGHDCDSVSGFNDGRYLDDGIEVSDESEALQACIDALSERYGPSSVVSLADSSATLITGYYDGDGNELDQDEWEQLNGNGLGSYSYVFVSWEVTA